MYCLSSALSGGFSRSLALTARHARQRRRRSSTAEPRSKTSRGKVARRRAWASSWVGGRRGRAYTYIGGGGTEVGLGFKLKGRRGRGDICVCVGGGGTAGCTCAWV